MPRRAAAPPPASDLLDRIDRLEQRVLQLETGRVGPGDGRAAVPSRGKKVTRCKGCGLPLRRLKGRCAACKRPLDTI
jgi:hypothetical protein